MFYFCNKTKKRLSDDVPVQSDSVPLVNIYFTLCMSFSLIAMIWFSYMNLLRLRKRVPSYCRYIVVNIICPIMRIDLTKSPRRASVVKSQPLPSQALSLTAVLNQDGTNRNVLSNNNNNNNNVMMMMMEYQELKREREMLANKLKNKKLKENELVGVKKSRKMMGAMLRRKCQENTADHSGI